MEGGDPAAIAGWIAEVQGEKLGAEAELAAFAPSTPPTVDALRDALAGLGPMVQVLAEADPADKAALYAKLGISITYDPVKRRVRAEALPSVACVTERVGGGVLFHLIGDAMSRIIRDTHRHGWSDGAGSLRGRCGGRGRPGGQGGGPDPRGVQDLGLGPARPLPRGWLRGDRPTVSAATHSAQPHPGRPRGP